MEKKSSRRYIVLFTTVILMLALISISIGYGKKEKSDRVEKFIELADRAYNRAKNLIDILKANDTALGIIESHGLSEQLNGNMTLLETGGAILEGAITALGEGDDEVAIESAKEAFAICREVFEGINQILREAGLEREDVVDGWGLLEALQRCLERIEKIESMAGKTTEIQDDLDEARDLCDIERAKELLAEGRVDEVVQIKAQVNRLISQAFVAVKNAAKELRAGKIKNYQKTVEKLYKKIEHQIDILERQGFDVTSLREKLAEVGDMLQNLSIDVDEAITQYIEIRNTLEEIWNDLREMRKGPPPTTPPLTQTYTTPYWPYSTPTPTT